jgi:hypothetical protein
MFFCRLKKHRQGDGKLERTAPAARSSMGVLSTAERGGFPLRTGMRRWPVSLFKPILMQHSTQSAFLGGSHA